MISYVLYYSLLQLELKIAIPSMCIKNTLVGIDRIVLQGHYYITTFNIKYAHLLYIHSIKNALLFMKYFFIFNIMIMYSEFGMLLGPA